MAEPSNSSNIPVCVIGLEFCRPYPFDMVVDTNSSLRPRGNLLVTDTDHKIILKTKRCDSSWHDQRLLLDASETPIALIREKARSAHERWEVFRGDSKGDLNMIFTTKTPHMIQIKTKLNVFLAKNTSKDTCDYKIEGSWSKSNCTIYRGESSIVIAQMHSNRPSENVKLSEGKFMVTVYPNVDYAFVVALIAIIDAMKSSDEEAVEAATQGVIQGTIGGLGS